ncbi:hypothetical protein B9T31_04465 [Acinetobacter sp. ANC 4558]|uniref:hypothetical protein n=1 Tax=Acinetobacter sp. ANC 4558 TaxID=1977876 RepID=UPI000A346EA7|nr:hypothetical protein [Acinetobacter sp. ANC 4558]OTG87793.1 hypothetical protein B9T31_04465 [Acinetobacter sp. ANC 4558]
MTIDHSSPEQSPWGWKALIISSILGALFLGFFYLAVTNDADYMPSQKNKENTQQHAFKTAPAMSQESLEKAQEDKAKREAISVQNATETSQTEHTNSNDTQTTQHGH